MGTRNSAAIAKLKGLTRLHGATSSKTVTQQRIVDESQEACRHDGFFLLQGDDIEAQCALCSKRMVPLEGYKRVPFDLADESGAS